jgi:hypothetical protein
METKASHPATHGHPVPETPSPSPQSLILPEPIPAEVAFEHIGYFTPASKRIKGITTKEKILAERTNPDGTRTVLTIRILGTGKYGLPITSDLDYYRAFLKLLDALVDHCGHIPEPIPIPTRTLIRAAGKQVSAQEFRAVQDWIRRGNATAIQGFYYNAVSGDYIEIGGEPLFPRYVMRGQRLPTGEDADTHAVWLASWFRTNYLYHHVRPLDLAFHLRLRKPIAKALYPLLELGWYATSGQPYTKSYFELCHEFLLHESRYLSRIKQQLDPAHHELVQQRFLERWEYRPAAKGPSWVISYHPGPKFFEDQQAREARRHRATRIVHASTPLALLPPSASAPPPPLLAEILAVCGDRQNQAAYQKVLQEYPEAPIHMALAETRHAAQEGRIRKSQGAYFMDTLKRLTTLRAAPVTPPAGVLEPAPGTVPAAAPPAPQDTAATAAQEHRALAHAREHTEARLTQVLAAFSPEQRQQLDQRATAQLTLREHDVGYGIMLRVAREQLLLHEQLGFDGWPRLVAQVRARGSDQAGEDVLEACRLEAILDDMLVVSVPTTQDKRRFTEHYLGVLEELASTPPPRTRIQVLVR